jgi:hypothetical protein
MDARTDSDRPLRLLPDEPLPSYSYIPGRFPHPLSDPRGHSFGLRPKPPGPPDPGRWQSCRPYLLGLDLFNHGYYWEAHEVWEGLWHACGHRGTTANFIKGLIKLAAAGVKVREGIAKGVHSHARRAVELFQQTAQELGGENVCFMGLGLADLIHFAQQVANRVPLSKEDAGNSVMVVFDFVLRPA